MNFKRHVAVTALVGLVYLKPSLAEAGDLHGSMMAVFLTQPAGLLRAFNKEDVCAQLGEFSAAGAEARQANISQEELRKRFVAPQKVKVVRDLQNAVLAHIYLSDDAPVQVKVEVFVTCAGALAEAAARQAGE